MEPPLVAVPLMANRTRSLPAWIEPAASCGEGALEEDLESCRHQPRQHSGIIKKTRIIRTHADQEIA
ncbi:MAG: hypothetical protein OXC07_08995 [Kistimonas sp.]|nr:hypothetical protein [Kistimonas sp.]